MITKARKLNEKMHMVIPVYDSDGTIYAYIHNEPISREMFEAYFLILAKTFAAIHTEGLGEVAGPRVSAMFLKRIAERNEDETAASSLMNEIRRLTNVLYRTPTGWEQIPYQDCISSNLIDEDDVSEVENAIVFFTCTWHMHRKSVVKEVLPGAAKLWGALISSLSVSAFQDSLRVSKKEESTGENPAPESSVAY